MNAYTEWGGETTLFIGIKKNLTKSFIFSFIATNVKCTNEIRIQAKKFSLFEYHSRKLADVRGLLVIATCTASTFSGVLTVLALPTLLVV
jgi:hypothetical protein